tara:strand:- start:292 stop:564 length:273 start_codon:yes stop_codon:yes gene_type:complete
MRVKFKSGEQRKFLDLVISKLNCISLRGILQFGFDISYSSLKNYYTERRLLPQDFFKDLCYLAKINVNRLNVEYLKDNWGRVKGGKNGKR